MPALKMVSTALQPVSSKDVKLKQPNKKSLVSDKK